MKSTPFMTLGTFEEWKKALNAETEEERLRLGIIAFEKEEESEKKEYNRVLAEHKKFHPDLPLKTRYAWWFADWTGISKCCDVALELRIKAGIKYVDIWIKKGEFEELRKISNDLEYPDKVKKYASENIEKAINTFIELEQKEFPTSLLHISTSWTTNLEWRNRCGLAYVEVCKKRQISEGGKNDEYSLAHLIYEHHTWKEVPKKVLDAAVKALKEMGREDLLTKTYNQINEQNRRKREIKIQDDDYLDAIKAFGRRIEEQAKRTMKKYPELSGRILL